MSIYGTGLEYTNLFHFPPDGSDGRTGITGLNPVAAAEDIFDGIGMLLWVLICLAHIFAYNLNSLGVTLLLGGDILQTVQTSKQQANRNLDRCYPPDGNP